MGPAAQLNYGLTVAVTVDTLSQNQAASPAWIGEGLLLLAAVTRAHWASPMLQETHIHTVSTNGAQGFKKDRGNT